MVNHLKNKSSSLYTLFRSVIYNSVGAAVPEYPKTSVADPDKDPNYPHPDPDPEPTSFKKILNKK